jgi:hypothetical protein
LVVIPDLLLSKEKIDDLVDNLHGHFLRNDRPNLYFGLLTDWMDSRSEHEPGDDDILNHVLGRLRELNRTHATEGRIPFFLLHRKRKWVERDNLWMGYERKRGKLEELNELVLHGDSSQFLVVEADRDALSRAKYVITLDNDTQLLEGEALKLISIMAHPANTPQFDDNDMIVAGHAILQPRMLAAPGKNASWYERFRARESGDDPKKPHFDLYHEVFGEGCFMGVGIYVVEAFSRSLRGKIPENLLLSHDIIEGNFARSGRARQVCMFETVPPTFHAESRRRHRWTRGDWQNASWLFSSVPTADGRQKNKFSILSRWKIFECMRSSLFPLALTLTLFLCAATNSLNGGGLVILGAVLFPIVFNIVLMLFAGEKPKLPRVADRLVSAFMIVMFAPFEGVTNTDAVARAIFRMKVSKQRLLEWVPSSAFDNDNIGLLGYARYMWKSPAIAALLVLWIWMWSAETGPLVTGVIILWAIAPLFAWYISRRPEAV